MTTPLKYDVAISFLSRDEPIGAALHTLLSSGLKVFFYPRSQEELAGTDGLESMRKPFVDDSLVSVVLYREQWGKTPWTRVEETAIKDGCLKHGWQRLFFMSLDDAAPLPVWLPNTHIRFSYASYSVEQAAGAIKARTQECGGVIAPTTAMDRARVVQAEADRLKKKEQLFGDQQWIQGKVRPTIEELFKEISRLAAQISSELGMPVRSAYLANPRSTADVCSLTNGQVGLSVVWDQPYTNVMGRLEISEFHNGIILPGERKLYVMGSAPPAMAKYTFLPDLSIEEHLCWSGDDEPGEQIATVELADKAVQMFLDLCQRAHRGEIDTTSEFHKHLQRQTRQR